MVRALVSVAGVVSASRIMVEKHEFVKASDLEVCCLCFQETGEQTKWDIKSFPDDAQADLQGDSYLDCRQDQGDGSSKCSAYCDSLGYEMKGCMKGAGMSLWREVDHWKATTTAGQSSWSCVTDTEGDSCGCVENSLLQVQDEVEEVSDEVAVVSDYHDVSGDLEVCCLCFQETGEKTNWDIMSFPDDAQADLQGDSYMDCRQDQGDGSSKCSAYCDSLDGYEMKGCMKGAGMSLWRGADHWDATTTAGQSSWSCVTDTEGDSCGCVENSLLQTEDVVEEATNEVAEDEEESGFCTPRCVTKANCKLGQDMQIWSRTNKMWCRGQIVGTDGKLASKAVLNRKNVKCPAATRGINVIYTCRIKGKDTKYKKLVLWKDPKGDNVNKMVQYTSMFR